MIRTHTITGRASTVYRGLSLVEMVIAIPLVGLVLVGVLSLVGASKSAQLKASLGRQGHLVAQQLMSEILRQDYADPTIAQTTRDDILSTGTSTYTLGRDAVTGRDETAGSDRSLFNDVDDYDMWVAGPPEAKDGTVFADLQGWSRFSMVSWSTSTQIDANGQDDVGLKTIRVNVKYNGVMVASLTAVKSIGLAWLEACCFGDGSCALLRAEACAAAGGTAQGPKTSCANTECPTGSNVLFVTGGTCVLVIGQDEPTCTPTAEEAARIALIESWGYTVTLISHNAAQSGFDAAFANADVAYVSSETSPADLQVKLRDTTIGVVNEQVLILQHLELASGNPTPITLTDASITDNTHYITAPFSVGVLTLSSPWQPFYYVNSGVAAGVQELASVFSKPSLLIAEAGSELLGGWSAPGRRVQLPWGAAGFDFSALNADGQTIMHRAIEWAAEAPTRVLFVTSDTPTTQEQARIALIESWGFGVTLISDTAAQAEFDTAITTADVAYVSPSINGGSLAHKLTGKTIGIVNEFPGKLDNFGFCSTTGQGFSSDAFSVSDPAHYITSPFGGGAISISSTFQMMSTAAGTLAPDLQVAAGFSGTPSLVTLDIGAQRYDGNPAPARRVHLPYDDIPISSLTVDGQTLMRRAIEWAAEDGGGQVCGDATCDAGETSCTCPADCGAPAASEDLVTACDDGLDNDCDTKTDCADLDCLGAPACACGNGTCESGEDCTSCPADCPSVTGGKPANRYCCGNGITEAAEGDGSICDGNY